MSAIRVFSLYSGSGGNAFLIRAPQGNLLIDAGKSARRLCRALDALQVSPDTLSAILVTHEHNDHISALPVFLKRHPAPVHLPQGCCYRLESEESVQPCLHPHPPVYTEQIAGMRVTAFPTPHDSAASSGYRIEIPLEDGGCYRIGYATDIGYVTPEIEEALLGCDAVILESNHDPEMLRFGPYPYELKKRIASKRGHLANEECAALAARLCAAGTRALMLAHLSRENNTPDTAQDACVSAVADERIRICVADPEEITELCTEELL